MAAGFLGGALSGYADQATKKKTKKKDDGGNGQGSPALKYLSPLWMLLQRKKKSNGDDTGGSGLKPHSYKRGGRVKKTGMAKVHKGERVLTKKQAKRYKKR